ncbi:ABC transporter permease [Mycolicibacterium holsaticum]|uniref:ABC transporter permease n=1 Tax=Mycolicibacterium holsaticum TaxID=152142 RepID=UPI001C7D563D|nr:ABC transporter [Mycolicibacterium holsaticum]MDA4105844.1 ABC transporter [Mycolicibacterium holsaticum DSM 44478 = JCM 12374]QZA13802.1 ABC transporter [Mycolicibacterium holsaticum DSM 44478 = JCM 12374]UNC08737.1 ABC transporter [Mycolicibacterium holsaticum DSM 44478 = JCM 12374]
MTATTTSVTARHTRQPDSSMTGTGRLIALALRRDRIRLPVWIAALTLTMWYTPTAFELAYPEEADRVARANLIKTPAGIMFSGPMFGRNETDIGAMFANEVMLSVIIAASILAILTVVRHTRAEEERGAAELVLAAPVGRYAPTGAAIVVVAGLNAVLAVTMTVATAATGLDVIDSAAVSVGIAGVAMVFGAVAAVTAQLWRTARLATGMAMAVLGAAVVVRGVGDVIDHSGSALSWCSPIAWAQQMRAFVDLRWWPLAMLVALAAALLVTTAVLQRSREYDAGRLPSGGEHPDAPPIRGVLGLYLIQQRGQIIGWSVGLFLAGLSFGSLTQSLLDMAEENELVARMLSAQGNDGIYTSMTQFLAAAATAFVAIAVLRLNADEQSGIAEAVLAGAVSRWRWLLSAVGASLVGALVLLFSAGLGNGIGAAVTLGEPETVIRLTLAALAHLPAMAVIAGIAAVAFALRQTWIAWLVVTFVVVSLYLGALLRLPQWLLDLSPVGRTTVPLDVPVTAMGVMVVVAAGLTTLAGLVFRRRDAM